MWPSADRLVDTLGSALLLAPVFLWRHGARLAAGLLVPIGAVYLGYFLAVRSAPDEYFWFTILGSHTSEAMQYAASYRVRDGLWLLAWLVAASGAAWWIGHRPLHLHRALRAVLVLIAWVWLAWAVVSIAKQQTLVSALSNIDRVYPLGLLESLARQQAAQAQIFSVPGVAPPTASVRADLIVVVLGESASALRWSLLGYGGHPTNEDLTPVRSELQVLSVLSNGNNTAQAVPMLLSGSELDRLPVQGLPTWLDWAHAAGFRVVTLSNQSRSGIGETFFHVAYRQRSDRYVNLPAGARDSGLTPLLRQALDEARPGQPLLVTLHTYGSHPRVGQRYEPQQARWDDPYDNSIAASSQLLAQWIRLLHRHAKERRAVLLYISDHGLNLPACGSNYTHGSAQSAYEVPFMLWSNAAFRADQPQWSSQATRNAWAAPDGLPRYDNRVFAATMADLLGRPAPYPSLGSAQTPPPPALDGTPFATLVHQDACEVRRAMR
ncbi:sulfatase-like hydrolase/transferase [Comamonas sp. NLF-1-9]|uniref:sulfatase-like hydrolase/transferase n=1 Tax=Comamonas sp. NLF-1-9 TaxID=2853163 RepID=UPI001C47368C|nr:sulfatase-like hydrolase/transferase [Comamonas sp. NLF-1-9]QXL84382.1 sulfatase-like hydrolase/transferase [Comamonas sp. NLF-1-9]